MNVLPFVARASALNVPQIVSSIKPSALRKRAEPVAKQTIVQFGTQLLSDVGSTDPFNVSSPSVKAFLKEFGGKRIVRINTTTQKRVAKLLSRAVDEGKTTHEIAKELSAKFDQWSKGRAFVIAKTEVNTASNFGAWEGITQAGIEQKEWLSTQDGNVRDTHVELDGEVTDNDKPFESSSGATAQYPGNFGDPAEDINCRCGVLPVVNDKRLRLSARSRFWKSLESARKPWDKKMHSAFSKGFAEQKAAVLAALGA